MYVSTKFMYAHLRIFCYLYIYIHIHTQIFVCVFTYSNYLSDPIYLYLHCIHICIYICMYVIMRVHMYMYICIPIYIYIDWYVRVSTTWPREHASRTAFSSISNCLALVKQRLRLRLSDSGLQKGP